MYFKWNIEIYVLYSEWKLEPLFLHVTFQEIVEFLLRENLSHVVLFFSSDNQNTVTFRFMAQRFCFVLLQEPEMYAYIHTYVTYIHTYTHTILTYIHTHIHRYIHTYICHRNLDVPWTGHPNLQMRNWQFWIVTILLNLQWTDTLRHQKNHFTAFYRFLANLPN